MAKNCVIQQQMLIEKATSCPSSHMYQPMVATVWGRIYGKNIKVKSLDIKSETFTVGRGENNNLIISPRILESQKILTRISKVHFVISRQKCDCDLHGPVYIEDHSRNGTFVNGERIGANNRHILQNNDIISLSHPTYKAFVFADIRSNVHLDFPKEITLQYHASCKLGSGASGVIHLVYERRTCIPYAIKIIKKNLTNHLTSETRNVLNEVQIMKRLQHPCVIQLRDIFDRTDLYMVMEFMKGGDLLNRILDRTRLSEQISKLYFYQMCNAVKYLHSNGITHRDLKPDNVLLETLDDNTLLKLTDFGVSKYVPNSTFMRTLCGTSFYVAPEVLTTWDHRTYTKKVDVWGLGVILFICLSGTLPFSDAYGSPVIEQIKTGEYRFNHPSWRTVSERAMSLIKNLLVVDAGRRFPIGRILKNEWLRDSQMESIARKLMKMETIDIENDENSYEPPVKRSKF